MQTHRFQQRGRTHWPILAGYLMIEAAVFVFLSRNGPIPSAVLHGLWGGALLMAFMVVLFHALHIEVGSGRIRWWFTLGWPGKSIPLEDVVAARRIELSFRHGWGIHHTEFGWLYNVAIGPGIQIELRNGRKYAISVETPDEVLALIIPARA